MLILNYHKTNDKMGWREEKVEQPGVKDTQWFTRLLTRMERRFPSSPFKNI
jgi:hypothetical protein